jgi:putative hydrolase of the HAD superfamily
VPEITAVTFDYWDTLVRMDGEHTTMRDRQIDGFSATLADAGYTFERERFVEVFAENWDRFEERWAANTGQYTPADATDYIAGRLGVPLEDGLRERLIDTFRVVGEGADLDVAPGAHECLATLRDAGLPLGIVCDVGLTSSPTLRARLEGFGLLGFFDAWAFSDETGWFKPAREAFEPALAGLGVQDPSTVAHVGDNVRTDVAGALALGMTAIRYTGLREVDPRNDAEAHHVVDDLRAIPSLLGLD